MARTSRSFCCQLCQALNRILLTSPGSTDTIQTFPLRRNRYGPPPSLPRWTCLKIHVVFLIVFTFVSAAPIIFQCNPVAAAWDFSLREPPDGTGTAKCMNLNVFIKFGVFNSCMSNPTYQYTTKYLSLHSYQHLYRCTFRRASHPHDLDLENQHANKNLTHGNLKSRFLVSHKYDSCVEQALALLLFSACGAAIYKTPIQYHFFEDPDSTGFVIPILHREYSLTSYV